MSHISKSKMILFACFLILLLLLIAYFPLNRGKTVMDQAGPVDMSLPHMVKYTDHIFGFTFDYLSTWVLNRKGNIITLGNTDQYGDTVTLVEIKGNTVTTSNDAYGSVTYTYKNGQLMTTGISSSKIATTSPGVAVPLFVTGNKWVVVPGTSSAKTDIVFIPKIGFIIVDSGKSGYTRIVDPLVKSFVATSTSPSFHF